MKQLVINFIKQGGGHAPVYINEVEVGMVEGIKFQGVMITYNLSWSTHIDVTVKKVQQRLYFLMRPRKFGLSIKTLTNFYTCTVESILSKCVTAWYGNCSAQD
eukprot:g26556.t1